jgi:lipopolysaccharide/colanic/teichoic acid biosynthesis glycosyltransferase
MRTSVRIAKRTFDILAAGVGLALTVPLYPIIGAAIYLNSPGSVLFRQRRAGRLLGREPGVNHHFRFEEFDILKFRTMKPNAEATTGAVVSAEGDDRVTRVGRFLRRTRLDELPQLWNVLRGEMSLVGPRPSQPSEIEHYEPDDFTRLLVKPGVTGMWQVSGRSDLCFEDAVKLDSAYVRDWSPALDLKILLKTVAVVLQCRGAC